MKFSRFLLAAIAMALLTPASPALAKYHHHHHHHGWWWWHHRHHHHHHRKIPKPLPPHPKK